VRERIKKHFIERVQNRFCMEVILRHPPNL